MRRYDVGSASSCAAPTSAPSSVTIAAVATGDADSDRWISATAAPGDENRHDGGGDPANSSGSVHPGGHGGAEAGNDPTLESLGRFHLRCGEQQSVGHRAEALEQGVAVRADRRVRQQSPACRLADLSQCQLVSDEIELRAADGPPCAHGATSATAARSRLRPVRIRVFAVPSGMPSMAAISLAVRPARVASRTARRCSMGKLREFDAEPAELVSILGRLLGVGARRRGEELAEEIGIEGHRVTHSHGVDREVAGDREEPRGHRRPPGVVGRGMAPRALERDLGDVVGERRITGHGDGQPEDPSLEPPDKHHGRVPLLEPDRCEERLIGQPIEMPHHTMVRAGHVNGLREGQSVIHVRS